MQEIVDAIESTIKINTIVDIQQKLLNLKVANMTVEKFKERLLNLLDELEKSYTAMGCTHLITKNNLIEQTVAILKIQNNNPAAYALLRTEQANAKTPNQLIEFYFTDPAFRETSQPVMAFNRYSNPRDRTNNFRQNRPNNYNRQNNFNSNHNYNRNNNGFSNRNRNNGYNTYRNYNNSQNYNNQGIRRNNYDQYNNRNQNSNRGRGQGREQNFSRVNVINSENYETSQSHGDRDRL